MKKSNKLYADEEDLIERFIQKVKENQGLDITEEQARSFYNSVKEYIYRELRSKSYASVKMAGLGTAYYHRTTLKGISGDGKSAKVRAEARRNIKKHFYENQPFINSHKDHLNCHYIKSYDELNEEVGATREDVINMVNSAQ